MMENENFPRGGTHVSRVTGDKRKHEPSLFALETPKKSKKLRGGKVKKMLTDDVTWRVDSPRGALSYMNMQDDMLVLIRVRQVTNLGMQVEFPGLIYGSVAINEISETFTKKLSKYFKRESEGFYGSALKNVVKVGQFMPAKILAVSKLENGHDVQATINPQHINATKKRDMFIKGEVVWANVVSKLDHGYELTLGINNCRVFLPFKNTDDLKVYDIGEPLYCVVHKVDSSDCVTTLTVSAKKQHISNCQTNDLSLNAVLPGMKVNFLIEEISPQGIKGQFLDDCFGFINDIEIFMADKNKKLKEGSTVKASVLYIEPITKVTYLTLRDLDDLPEPEFESGKVLSAKVALSGAKGLYLRLAKDCIGFVTNKRLLNTIPKDTQVDIIQAIRSKYPVGSQHDCRILNYNHMQQLYICTLEKQIVKEKIFSVKDLTVGQAVKVIIEKNVAKGLVVKTGQVQGFVPNIHLSNVKYTGNMKAKFSVGMRVDARVLKVTSEGHVLFTLKQGFLESEQCLLETENALPNSQYVGCVVQTKLAGALITFYGDAKGWLRKKTLNSGNSGRYIDPRDFFFVGQVVKVWVLGFKNNKLLLSLHKPSEEEEKKYLIDEEDQKITELVHSEVVKEIKKKRKAKKKKHIIDEDANEMNTVVNKEELSGNVELCSGNGDPCLINESQSILSGAHSFYTVEDDDTKNDSSEDDDDEPEPKRKRKKLSATERADLAKKEEERITQIERHLADTKTTPQSAEEFDRLLLANPNSSEFWLQYISMHVTATELDKARAVGKKAIETINMTLVKEKFNIWIALLNLENMYGTKESFEKLFEEAVKYNDSLDVYLSVIKILGTTGKLLEMEEKVKKLRSREKQNIRMWLEVGRVYYSLKKLQEARNLKEAALKSILDKRKQFDIIVRFAVMEFQLGDWQHAVTNFETILDNYPSKVNIWIIYVDQLVKQKQIEHARKVLERAVSQRFNVKTMKVLFQKFLSFEEQQGTPEAVEKVKDVAKEYVTNL